MFHSPPAITASTSILLAQGPAQQIGHVADHPAQIDRTRLQRLAAGKGKKLAGQARAPRHRAHGVLQPLRASVGLALTSPARHRQIEIGADDLQQIVEVMRHAAGQMADGFHLLGLAHHGFGPHARGDVQHPDQEAARGQGRAIDIQLPSAPADADGIADCFARARRDQDRARPVFLEFGQRGKRGPVIGQRVGKIQQAEELAVEGAEHAIGGEIGDAVAHSVQGRLQHRGFTARACVRPRPG